MQTAILQLIRDAFTHQASDLFLMEGEVPRIRLESDLRSLASESITRAGMRELWIYCGIDPDVHRDADISWQLPEYGRMRVNFYQTLGRLAATMRPIRSGVPKLAELGLPDELLHSWLQRRFGLILVTGPTGSGKSTTVASSLDWINHHFARHIVTLEDPIEYLFENRHSLFSQREVRLDSENFATGLRAALRQSPDVLFLGEIRDAESALIALQAAETGHLVISTIHSSSVVEALDRFSHLVRSEATGALNLLASQLIGIISQQLLPRLGGGLFLAVESFQNEAASRRWILDHQLTALQDHLLKSKGGVNRSLLDSLVSAARQGLVDPDVARSACPRPQDFDRAMRGISG